MISDIAWENVLWLKESFFQKIDKYGGKSIAVDSFEPYFDKHWVQSLDINTARSIFLNEIAEWSVKISSTHLTNSYTFTTDKKVETIHTAKGGDEYSYLLNFLFRSHYNLYCLSTYRKTIEELALSAYSYCDSKRVHDKKSDKKAFADFRRLLRLSNSFLLTEWVHEMIVKAISNQDKPFFRIISNSVKINLLEDSSTEAIQWLLVILLWYMGGKDIKPRREFLHILIQKGILSPETVDNEDEFRSQLATFGITTT